MMPKRESEEIDLISKSIDGEIERRINQSREADGAPNMGSPRGSETSNSASTL